ncbi:bromodomain-containing protein -like [Vespula maculifrons]|uniref:Bromodomain-containing protein -like n=1 Tax=Vespula maculifrons TaxID=7453 RepID=A0ABD2BIJ9_VESMC|nr:putative uncharacterized protein DDB_G0282133 isoform X1 [Vespula vulgaris]XP_050858932.1 putative uncharacterized protein DDB_G0282133 isoform X1 [Vespula vulgaris]
MSRSKKSTISHKLEENKDKFQKPVEQGNHDNSLLSMESKQNEISKNSPIRNSNDIVDRPGHSTPFQKKHPTDNIEDSPEPDYHCSPISVPCTQDGNEVAWDWQNSTKPLFVRSKTENDHLATPKQTRILQKKRNSNSPLLHKPLRRRLVKADNIESIGKFAAELKALTEKMKTIQRNDEDYIENDINNKDKIENHQGKDESDILIVLEENTSANKISTSLEELFDESIEDSMVKCSQEIEEKFNLCTNKKNNTTDLSNGSREKDTSVIKEKIKSANSSSDNSKSSLFSQNSLVLNVSSFCKTYSKNTPNCKKNIDTDVKRLEMKEDIIKQSPLNNNIINTHNGNLQNWKNSIENNSSELFEIPDDSFDDCLATCIEDEKLLSETTEYDDIFPDSEFTSNKNEKNYKHSSSMNRNMTKNIIKSNNAGYNSTSYYFNQTSMDSLNKLVNNSGVNNNLTESRKFFKTRSLSDSYFGQEKTTSLNIKPSTSNSRQIIKHSSSSNLPSKLYVNTSSRNTTNGNVNANKNIKSISDKESMHALNTSKIILRDSAIRSTKDSQTILCTPEEIERKRLDAKMRLEAKRKMQINVKPTITSEIPPKRVQR